MRDPTPPQGPGLWSAARLLLLATGIVVAVLLVGQLVHVLLLLFGSVLFAVLLRAVADPIERTTPISGRWAVALAVLLVAGVLAGFLWLMGAQIRAQLLLLLENLPDLVDQAENRLGIEGLGDWLEQRRLAILEDGNLAVDVASYSTRVVSGGAHVLVVLAAGIYLALTPRAYRDGVLLLIPAEHREGARETMTTMGLCCTKLVGFRL